MTIAVLFNNFADQTDDFLNFWKINRVGRQQFPVGRHSGTPIRIGRIVAQFQVFKQVMHRIGAKAVDAAREPKAQHVEHRLLYFAIAPVQVGLLFEKRMIVILSGYARPIAMRRRRNWRANWSALRRPALHPARYTNRVLRSSALPATR